MFLRIVLAFTFAISAAAVMNAEQPQPTAGVQVEQQFTASDSGLVPYLFYLPKDYDAAGKGVPMMLFLHGRGESNGPLSLVAKWGPPRFVAEGKDLPYLLVSPQCPKEDSWAQPTQQKRLRELIDDVIEKYNVDPARIYLTGLSMGGFGSWRLAADQPERFAAVVPVCGGGDPADAAKLASLPIWVFHGDQDTAVPFSRSVEMVDAIRDAGGKRVRFTTLEHVGHNSWSAAYATPELYGWLDQQKTGAKE